MKNQKNIQKAPLTDMEQKALDCMIPCCDQALFAKEIVKEVSIDLKCSINQAKGYIGSLCNKGYVQADKYRDNNIGLVEQFSIL